MTEGPSTFDPRYDVRFQRGYTPPPEERVSSAVRNPRPEPPPGDRPASDTRSQPARPEAAPAARPMPAPGSRTQAHDQPPTRQPPVGPDPVRPSPSTPAPEPDAPARTAGPGGDDVASAPASAVLTRWLWLVAGAGLAFVVVGTAMYWSILSRRNPFNGGLGGGDALADQVLTSLAPQLVMAGILGIVGAVLCWAVLAGAGAGKRR